MESGTSKIAMLQALGQLGDVERERFLKVITLLQANSPEAITGQDGARAGMFVFRGTDKLYRESFIALPLYEHLMFVQWPAERAKGAPIANHIVRPGDAAPDEDGDWRLPNGDRVIKTRYLYLALVTQGKVDFSDIWALALTSSGLGFFDAEFASQYPMTISVDGTEIKGPLACCKFKFGSELHSNARGTWWKVKYIKGSTYGMPNGPTWDEMVRGAELEADMRNADALARQQHGLLPRGGGNSGGGPERIGATSPRDNDPLRGGAVLPQPREGRIAVTSGKMAAYDPGPPEPPPITEDKMAGREEPEDPIDVGGFDDGPPF
jgi:hypothetical protein